ncbi:MAG: hypothetical protein V2I31_10920 [Mariniphaga sp.]|jgi:hypothetical protein|nr:hypothetical protein [Mariniphaga sp.]
MKRFFNNTEKKNFQAFEVLTTNEMFKVRGGGDTRPATRDKDIFEGETR